MLLNLINLCTAAQAASLHPLAFFTSSYPLKEIISMSIQPTIVEVFQSQGCSSCPPTYSNLLTLLNGQELSSSYLILSFHVTYWDHLGWKDTFAKQVFNDRQHDYVKRLDLKSAFTPQIVVNGRYSGVVERGGDLGKWLFASANEEESTSSRIAIEVDTSATDKSEGCEAMLQVSREKVEGDLDLWLVKYDPTTVEVEVRDGENAGRKLPYRNVVKIIEKIGFFAEEDRKGSFWLDCTRGKDLRLLVLVQQGYGGPIVGNLAL